MTGPILFIACTGGTHNPPVQAVAKVVRCDGAPLAGADESSAGADWGGGERRGVVTGWRV